MLDQPPTIVRNARLPADGSRQPSRAAEHGWIAATGLERYAVHIKEIADDTGDLKVMVDADVDEFVQEAGIPKMKAKRLRIAPRELDAAVTTP